MPHITVKCFPGRTEEQKQELAEKITAAVAETFNSSISSISVAIEDVAKEEWNTEVWDKEIGPKMEGLYKKPGYSRD